VADFSAKSPELPRATVIGTAEEMAEDIIAMLNSEDGKPLFQGSATSKSGKVDSRTRKYLQDSLAHRDEERAVIEPVLMR
jgi:hypothetical protein